MPLYNHDKKYKKKGRLGKRGGGYVLAKGHNTTKELENGVHIR